MSKTYTYARNMLANWSGYIANLLVAFFLSPFIVHSLGNSAYGVWSLLISLTGYLGLIEMGVMNGTGRYINYYLGRKEPQKVSYIVNTSLAFYCAVSVLLILAALAFSASLSQLFPKIPPKLAQQAQIALPIIAANIFFGFITATFRQMLVANERFDLQNLADIVVLGLRTIGVVAVLSAGYGFVSLAAIHVVTNLAGCVILFFVARWRGPQVNFGLRYVTSGTFKQLFNFGIFAFVGDLGEQVIYYTDSVVIGVLLGAAPIAFYNIGFILIDHGRKLIWQVSRVFFPDILQSGGRDKFDELRWLLKKSTRISMVLAVPLLVGFLTLGKEFITLWMGPEYRESAIILSILSISQFGATASRGCASVLIALGRVKTRAVISTMEACANLVLSIVLVTVFDLGIKGVAIGTTVPMLFFRGIVLPAYTCRLLNLGIIEFANTTFCRWLMAAVLFGIPCLVVANLPIAHSWPAFSVKVLVLSALYVPIGFFVSIDPDDRKKLLGMRRKPSEALCQKSTRL